MSVPAARAVFLSYASQDMEAARRISETLRASGIEVWFDADGGLEHGDEWDQKIRRQIKECIFFVPLISANTQARLEGYFRLEWELAAQRALSIASGVPFILPIVIDDTREPDALVPDRFRTVQWTRLPEGVVPPDVRAQLLKLWSHRIGVLGQGSDRPASAAYRPPALPPMAAGTTLAPGMGSPVRRAPRWPFGALAALAVLAALDGWFWFGRPAAPPPPAPATAAKATKELPPPAAPKPRGIAVLPFENLDGADQAYFASGLTEEVTLQLAKISALRVMSRAAVARFQRGAAELPAMARELGIGAVVVATVRHEGDRVRIIVQLLAAPSGETLWSEPYDGAGQNILGLQTDVAVKVARALQTKLAPAERARIERPATENAEAYALYLKARTIPLAESIDLLKQAIALDPRFGLAHSALSLRYEARSRTTGHEDMTRAIEAARQGVAVDPQQGRAHYILGRALGQLGQVDEARLAYLRAIELDASFQAALNDLSVLEANAGRLDQGVYWAKRGFPLAPNLANSFYHVSAPLLTLDDKSAERWLKAGEARFPADHPTLGYRIQCQLALIELRRGQPAAAVQRMRSAAAAVPRNGECQAAFTDIAFLAGAAEAGERIDQALQRGPSGRLGYSSYTPRTMRAFLYMKSGDRPRALPLIEAALAENRAAIAAGDHSSNPPYENAALYLLRGDRTAALDWLEDSYKAGNRDADFIKVDPIFTALAAEPRFIQLIDRINGDLREMRKHVDLSDLDELAALGK